MIEDTIAIKRKTNLPMIYPDLAEYLGKQGRLENLKTVFLKGKNIESFLKGLKKSTKKYQANAFFPARFFISNKGTERIETYLYTLQR